MKNKKIFVNKKKRFSKSRIIIYHLAPYIFVNFEDNFINSIVISSISPCARYFHSYQKCVNLNITNTNSDSRIYLGFQCGSPGLFDTTFKNLFRVKLPSILL